MLEITQAEDARAAMRGAAVVAGRVAVEPQHPLAPAYQMKERRGPHRAKTADHDVEIGHPSSPCGRGNIAGVCGGNRLPLPPGSPTSVAAVAIRPQSPRISPP